MRATLVALVSAIGIAAIAAAVGGSPTIAAAETERVKCIDCEGDACHVAHGAAFRSCIMTLNGCIAWDECG